MASLPPPTTEPGSQLDVVPTNQIDQLIRQTRAHHVQLSAMADVKANMLITMASIVVTLSIPRIMAVGSQSPLVVLVAFCLLTIGLASYAVMPKQSYLSRKLPVPGKRPSTFNILFFGDFSAMSYDKFEREMEDIMKDPQQIYRTQLREIHSLGVFLSRQKYYYLRLAYLSFCIGLTSCALMMVISGGF